MFLTYNGSTNALNVLKCRLIRQFYMDVEFTFWLKLYTDLFYRLWSLVKTTSGRLPCI